jgi:ankyrin repeat protein
MIASRYGYLLCAEILINNKAEVDLYKPIHTTALSYVCKHCNDSRNNDIYEEIIKLLLDNTANISLINHINNEFYAPIMYTCQYDNLNIAQLLIDRKADINFAQYENEITHSIAMFCCQFNSLNVFMFICKYRGFSLLDSDNCTIVLLCCKYNFFDALKLLLKYKEDNIDNYNNYNNNKNNNKDNNDHNIDINIDINHNDNDGMTGLMYACKNNNIDIIELLLQSNANVSIDNLNEDYIVNNNVIKLMLENAFARQEIEYILK